MKPTIQAITRLALSPISYTYERTYNLFRLTESPVALPGQAVLFPLKDSKLSSGPTSMSRRVTASNLSRLSIIQRASIPAAYCSAHINISSLIDLPKFDARASEANSKSCKDIHDASSRNSSGGSFGPILQTAFLAWGSRRGVVRRSHLLSQVQPRPRSESQPRLRRDESGRMAFTLTERMRLRVTEDMAREIRDLAEREHRPIEWQVRYLISLGLKQVRRSAGKGLGAETRPDPALAVPMPPQRRRSA